LALSAASITESSAGKVLDFYKKKYELGAFAGNKHGINEKFTETGVAYTRIFDVRKANGSYLMKGSWSRASQHTLCNPTRKWGCLFATRIKHAKPAADYSVGVTGMEAYFSYSRGRPSGNDIFKSIDYRNDVAQCGVDSKAEAQRTGRPQLAAAGECKSLFAPRCYDSKTSSGNAPGEDSKDLCSNGSIRIRPVGDYRGSFSIERRPGYGASEDVKIFFPTNGTLKLVNFQSAALMEDKLRMMWSPMGKYFPRYSSYNAEWNGRNLITNTFFRTGSHLPVIGNTNKSFMHWQSSAVGSEFADAGWKLIFTPNYPEVDFKIREHYPQGSSGIGWVQTYHEKKEDDLDVGQKTKHFTRFGDFHGSSH
jgi:hypothetical protein